MGPANRLKAAMSHQPLKISDLFSRFHKARATERAEQDAAFQLLLQKREWQDLLPVTAGAIIAEDAFPPEAARNAINICTAYYLWRQSRKRTIYRIKQETAAIIRKTSLSFVPESPPPSWENGVIVLESPNPDTPLYRDIFSICAYQTQDKNKTLRYFFSGLKTPDGITTFGLRSDLRKINDKMAAEGRLLDLDLVTDALEGPEPPERQQEALDSFRFVFAASYYIANPSEREHIKVSHLADGPREKKKTSVKKKKNPQREQSPYGPTPSYTSARRCRLKGQKAARSGSWTNPALSFPLPSYRLILSGCPLGKSFLSTPMIRTGGGERTNWSEVRSSIRQSK